MEVNDFVCQTLVLPPNTNQQSLSPLTRGMLNPLELMVIYSPTVASSCAKMCSNSALNSLESLSTFTKYLVVLTSPLFNESSYSHLTCLIIFNTMEISSNKAKSLLFGEKYLEMFLLNILLKAVSSPTISLGLFVYFLQNYI